MSSLHISLPESMKDFIDTQVAHRGFQSPSDYVQSLVRLEQEQAASEAVEKKLLEAVEADVSEMTPQDWSDIRREVHQRHAERSQR